MRSRGQETLEQVPIPVQVQLAANQRDQFDLQVNAPSKVAVSFFGPPSRLRELRRKLHRGALQVGLTVTVPEDRQNDSSFRGSLRLEPEQVPVPSGVAAVLPPEGVSITFIAHRLVERQLPVRLDYVGEFRLNQVKLDPATVSVR